MDNRLQLVCNCHQCNGQTLQCPHGNGTQYLTITGADEHAAMTAVDQTIRDWPRDATFNQRMDAISAFVLSLQGVQAGGRGRPRGGGDARTRLFRVPTASSFMQTWDLTRMSKVQDLPAHLGALTPTPQFLDEHITNSAARPARADGAPDLNVRVLNRILCMVYLHQSYGRHFVALREQRAAGGGNAPVGAAGHIVNNALDRVLAELQALRASAALTRPLVRRWVNVGFNFRLCVAAYGPAILLLMTHLPEAFVARLAPTWSGGNSLPLRAGLEPTTPASPPPPLTPLLAGVRGNVHVINACGHLLEYAELQLWSVGKPSKSHPETWEVRPVAGHAKTQPGGPPPQVLLDCLAAMQCAIDCFYAEMEELEDGTDGSSSEEADERPKRKKTRAVVGSGGEEDSDFELE
ncbi:hypothetical protein FN846DRAFT_1025075 [Sphaerosporella brunnea]|uniref:Uncharacterized protein n=1 Tax=Sphaerosporella brunnea TaxID=1250544 RepID=A0A5J5EFG1_9PEZI|nr:hypothetical protein FN846DRAFT_1025075 [Sphaerosporella brunnea]